MATRDNFEFELYRLNVDEDDVDLFETHKTSMSRNDPLILQVLKETTRDVHQFEDQGGKNQYFWAMRDFVLLSDAEQIYALRLARSTVSQMGEVVTKTTIQVEETKMFPPSAASIVMIFLMKRHLVVVEKYSPVNGTNKWRWAFSELAREAARELRSRGTLELEPIPPEAEILKAFMEFDRVTRLRVRLRLPNPELSQYAREVNDLMAKAKIRDLLQDMGNPMGISKEADALPRAAIELAQHGYGKGPATIEGVKRNKKRRVKRGGRAAQAQLPVRKDVIRPLRSLVHMSGLDKVCTAIVAAVSSLLPPPEA